MASEQIHMMPCASLSNVSSTYEQHEHPLGGNSQTVAVALAVWTVGPTLELPYEACVTIHVM